VRFCANQKQKICEKKLPPSQLLLELFELSHSVLSCVFHWLVKTNEWLYKIHFSAVKVVRDLRTKGVCLGFVVSNASDFPISFKASDFQVRLRDKVPTQDISEITHTVPAR